MKCYVLDSYVFYSKQVFRTSDGWWEHLNDSLPINLSLGVDKGHRQKCVEAQPNYFLNLIINISVNLVGIKVLTPEPFSQILER